MGSHMNQKVEYSFFSFNYCYYFWWQNLPSSTLLYTGMSNRYDLVGFFWGGEGCRNAINID